MRQFEKLMDVQSEHQALRSRERKGFCASGSPIGERRKHLRSSLLNVRETGRQRFLVSVPNLDVVGCSRTGFESDGMANDKGGRLGFRFADFARRLFAAVAAV